MNKLVVTLDQGKNKRFVLCVLVLDQEEFGVFANAVGECALDVPPEFFMPYISPPAGTGFISDVVRKAGYLPFVKNSTGTMPLFERYEVEERILSAVLAGYANSWVNYLLEHQNELPLDEIDPTRSDPLPPFSTN